MAKFIIKTKVVNTIGIETEKGEILKTIAYVDVCDIPRDFPMDINPRKQRMGGNVVKSIRTSLIENKQIFEILNKGITLIVKSQELKGKNLILDFDDEGYGLIDGGHTYMTILDVLENGLIDRAHNFVTLEVLSGEPIKDYTISIASARNTTVQVKDYSLTELDKGFEWIKQTLSGEDCLANIVFKENDIGHVKVNQLIWLLAVTNPNIFPVCTYGTYIRKGKAMRTYIQEYKKHGFTVNNRFYSSKRILKDLIALYDYMQCNYGSSYKDFIRLKPVKTTSMTSEFLKNELTYRVPNQWFYPAVCSIRSIITTDKDGYLKWVKDPFTWVEKALPKIVKAQIEIYKSCDLECCRSGLSIKNLYEIGLECKIDNKES